MARTAPVTPRKTPRKRLVPSTPGRATVSAVSLNARIHRILNAATELKRYSFDSSVTVSSGQTYYVNPLVGITQGLTISGRLGDKIKVEKIMVTGKIHMTAATLASTRITHLKVDDTSLISSSLTSYTGPYVYAGFPSIGVINGHENIVIKDSKYDFNHYVVNSFGTMLSTKAFKDGHDIMYASGTNTQVDNNYIVVVAYDNSGISATAATLWLSYSVFYRDA